MFGWMVWLIGGVCVGFGFFGIYVYDRIFWLMCVYFYMGGCEMG